MVVIFFARNRLQAGFTAFPDRYRFRCKAARPIAGGGRWPELVLWVAPPAAVAAAAALGETGPVTEVKVTADPALGPGEAQIGWSQGGAEIDVEAIAEAALERFRLQLDRCLQQGA